MRAAFVCSTLFEFKETLWTTGLFSVAHHCTTPCIALEPKVHPIMNMPTKRKPVVGASYVHHPIAQESRMVPVCYSH